MELFDVEEGAVGMINTDFFQGVLDGIQDSVKIVDRSFHLVYTNKTGLDTIGKPLAEATKPGAKCFDKFYHSSEQCQFCVIDKVFESGSPVFNVFHDKKNRGAFKEISAFPLKDNIGEVKYVIEIVRDISQLRKDLIANAEFSNIISQDQKMADVFEIMKSVAPTNSTALILGETGTGKELVARAIHQSSRRVDRKLVTINCGALPDSLLETELFGHEKGAFTGASQRRIGKFEIAHKGTLFLDEIGTISQSMQVKILRAIQEGEITRVGSNEAVKVDIRFICAANIDLADAVKKGDFREDLYYRINVMPIHLPPLRERGKDVELLAESYLKIFSELMGKDLRGFTPAAMGQMRDYHWPGNVRELRNLVERAVILSQGPYIERIDIPAPESDQGAGASGRGTLQDVVSAVERDYLINTLRACRGNISQTAAMAGVNTRTIHRKLKEFDIKKESFK